MFAKLFETEIGQVLVKLDTDPDEGRPEVRIYFQPEGAGVCSLSFSFKDNDEGWGLAEKVFDKTNEAGALRAVREATGITGLT